MGHLMVVNKTRKLIQCEIVKGKGIGHSSRFAHFRVYYRSCTRII